MDTGTLKQLEDSCRKFLEYAKKRTRTAAAFGSLEKVINAVLKQVTLHGGGLSHSDIQEVLGANKTMTTRLVATERTPAGKMRQIGKIPALIQEFNEHAGDRHVRLVWRQESDRTYTLGLDQEPVEAQLLSVAVHDIGCTQDELTRWLKAAFPDLRFVARDRDADFVVMAPAKHGEPDQLSKRLGGLPVFLEPVPSAPSGARTKLARTSGPEALRPGLEAGKRHWKVLLDYVSALRSRIQTLLRAQEQRVDLDLVNAKLSGGVAVQQMMSGLCADIYALRRSLDLQAKMAPGLLARAVLLLTVPRMRPRQIELAIPEATSEQLRILARLVAKESQVEEPFQSLSDALFAKLSPWRKAELVMALREVAIVHRYHFALQSDWRACERAIEFYLGDAFDLSYDPDRRIIFDLATAALPAASFSRNMDRLRVIDRDGVLAAELDDRARRHRLISPAVAAGALQALGVYIASSTSPDDGLVLLRDARQLFEKGGKEVQAWHTRILIGCIDPGERKKVLDEIDADPVPHIRRVHPIYNAMTFAMRMTRRSWDDICKLLDKSLP